MFCLGQRVFFKYTPRPPPTFMIIIRTSPRVGRGRRPKKVPNLPISKINAWYWFFYHLAPQMTLPVHTPSNYVRHQSVFHSAMSRRWDFCCGGGKSARDGPACFSDVEFLGGCFQVTFFYATKCLLLIKTVTYRRLVEAKESCAAGWSRNVVARASFFSVTVGYLCRVCRKFGEDPIVLCFDCCGRPRLRLIAFWFIYNYAVRWISRKVISTSCCWITYKITGIQVFWLRFPLIVWFGGFFLWIFRWENTREFRRQNRLAESVCSGWEEEWRAEQYFIVFAAKFCSVVFKCRTDRHTVGVWVNNNGHFSLFHSERV